MKVAVTGATGMLGRAIVEGLRSRSDSVIALSRDARSAATKLPAGVETMTWADPKTQAAPTEAFTGVDAVLHLLGEPISQRWTDSARAEIRESRVAGTRNLVEGLRAAEPRPRVLVSQSAFGVYGAHGDEPVDERTPAADDFLAQVVVAWEAEARRAEELGMRVALTRTGVVLSDSGGALEKMLPPFRLGVGGPVAGGRQYVPWVHSDDVVGALLFCLDNDGAIGPVNVTAPTPVTNKELSKALGRVLHRPAFAPVPALAVKLLYGDMAWIVTTGARALPRRLEELGYEFKRPDLEDALRAAVA
ncbi:MAG: uncharacterized protein QOD53_299 [Thermoleophilaceae bacterium]|nr:uncharacterized protein [Thermoleophilaceae bacterium]